MQFASIFHRLASRLSQDLYFIFPLANEYKRREDAVSSSTFESCVRSKRNYVGVIDSELSCLLFVW
jgi:hypothetical protein